MSQPELQLSRRLQQVKPSPTLAVDSRAKQLIAEGRDIINFGVGEPDYNTPDNVKEAGRQAIDSNKTRYTPASGIQDLKVAVAAKFKRDNGLEYEPGQILISSGAKHSIYNAVMALCGEGDEVLVPAPYWVSYPDQVVLAGGNPVVVDTTEETQFKVSAALLERHITPRTRALILNSPSNPTGSSYTRAELEELAELLVSRGIGVISDEIYEYLIYDGLEHVSIASLSDQIKELSIVVNGVSKSYAMTGWRIGYAAGPKHIISAMGDLQSHATSNPTTMSQWASLEALTGSQEIVSEMATEYAWRRDYAYQRTSSIPGLFATKPTGAFYVFPNISQLIGRSIGDVKINGGLDMAAVLLEQAGVAVVPGEAFGSPQNFRISYATSREALKEGFDRLEQLVAAAR